MIRSLSVKLIFSASFLIIFGFTSSNKKLTEDYVSIYKNIAISEMKRTGIPASIKLAQGLLESDLGRSDLASKANNHFGIKCGGSWTGDVYFKHDDDRDSDGNIVESCFRSFQSGEESYIAHSEFLSNPAKQSRYGFLFDLGSTDYEGWANGLKFSGYATDPSYANKLIKVIESNHLYKYDEVVSVPKNNGQIADSGVKTNDENPKKSNSEISKNNRYSVEKINDVKMIFANGAESVKQIAGRVDIDVNDLLQYNEKYVSMDEIPEKNEILFISRKKKSYHVKDQEFHTVASGETMYQISQKYGIRLESLLSKNNLVKDAIPVAGELISLHKNLSDKETPKHYFTAKFDSYLDFGSLK